MFDKVTITYRGEKYEIGRGRDFYGIWAAGTSRMHPQPLQWWPETSEGWAAAWTKFAGSEAPGTIVPVGRGTPPIAQGPVQAGEGAAAAAGGSTVQVGQASQGTALLDERPAPPDEDADEDVAPFSEGASFSEGPPFGLAGAPFGARTAPPAGARTGPVGAVLLLAAGVILGIAGMFPTYLGGASLAQQTAQVVPHSIYLAVWTASAVLILLGGVRLRLGALLGAGLSIVTFGLFFADAGTSIAEGAHLAGWGLWLSFAGWLACAAGSAMALLLRSAGTQDTPYTPGSRPGVLGVLRRLRGSELGPVIMLVLAGLGVAAAFAPAWDSFTLRTAAGQSESLTAGNAFSNPGPVIAGDIIVMVSLAAVVIVAALWRPIRHGAVLLAGAAIPMAAQAISALIQVAEPASPTQFGFTPAQATQAGLTIDSGVTPAFWIYCGFLVVLVVSCAWMLFTPREAPSAGEAEACTRPA